MAGQLTIDQLKASSGVLATQNGMTGIAKAWVRFTGGGSTAILASFNVSSVTYVGTGTYLVNITTAMPDANYSPVVSANNGDRCAGIGIFMNGTTYSAPTTTSFYFQCAQTTTTSATNANYACVGVFGN